MKGSCRGFWAEHNHNLVLNKGFCHEGTRHHRIIQWPRFIDVRIHSLLSAADCTSTAQLGPWWNILGSVTLDNYYRSERLFLGVATSFGGAGTPRYTVLIFRRFVFVRLALAVRVIRVVPWLGFAPFRSVLSVFRLFPALLRVSVPPW
jgi:hypothetical protein